MIHYLTPTRPATPQAVHSAEVALGMRLPEQYRRYLLTQANGGWIDDALLPGFPHVAVNHILGVDREDSDDLVRSCGHLAPLLGLGFLPVADAEGGNPICISTRTDDFGTVWFHDHELDFDEDGAFTQIAPSWDAFIDATQPDTTPTPAPAEPAKVWVSAEMETILRSQFAD